MDGYLQDLVKLYVYDIDSVPMCQIHFKRNLEAYEVVEAGELLGDLIAVCKNRDAIDFLSVLNEWSDEKYCIIGGKKYLRVAVVIAFNNEDESEETDEDEFTEIIFEKSSILDEAIEFLEDVERDRVVLSLNMLEMFLGKNMRYIPPHMVRRFDVTPTTIFEDEMYWVFEDAEIMNFNDLFDAPNCVYMYECDNLVEIIVALIHNVATHKLHICRCNVCGRFFVPLKRKDEKYCGRIRLLGELSCKEIGRQQVRKARLQNDRITKKYNSVYTNLTNKKRAQKYSGKELQQRIEDRIKELSTQFQFFKKSMGETDLLEWLDDMKKI